MVLSCQQKFFRIGTYRESRTKSNRISSQYFCVFYLQNLIFRTQIPNFIFLCDLKKVRKRKKEKKRKIDRLAFLLVSTTPWGSK
jgi:hypothetical protein